MTKRTGYAAAFRAAFPYTIPVMTGYLFIGMAFGVMMQEKGYNFLWAMLMSLVCYAGSAQYLAVNFFVPEISLLNVIFMEFMLNVRHVFYGLSLLEKFAKMGKVRPYIIFALSDETYSLLCGTKAPEGVEPVRFTFAIALLNQLYWIAGSGLGAFIGSVLPIEMTGVEFAMTALFVVIMVEQWMEKKNRFSVLIGLGCGVICLLLFGDDRFILPTMIAIMSILLLGKKQISAYEEKEEGTCDAC